MSLSIPEMTKMTSGTDILYIGIKSAPHKKRTLRRRRVTRAPRSAPISSPIRRKRSLRTTSAIGLQTASVEPFQWITDGTEFRPTGDWFNGNTLSRRLMVTDSADEFGCHALDYDEGIRTVRCATTPAEPFASVCQMACVSGETNEPLRRTKARDLTLIAQT